MDLVSETPTELYFHKNPVKVQLLAGAFFVVGVLIILFFGWKTEIHCNCDTLKQTSEGVGLNPKPECNGWCNVTQTNFWMYNEYKIQTRSIQAALLVGSGSTYRVVLLLTLTDDVDMFNDDDIEGEQITIIPFYSYCGYEAKRKIANKLNLILNGSWEPTKSGVVLYEAIDDRWISYLVGMIFMSILVLALLLTKREVCLLRKDENVLALIRSTALSRKEELYALKEISLVELHRNTQDRKTEYKVFFEIEPSGSSRSHSTITTSSIFGEDEVEQVVIETGNRWISMCDEGSHPTEEGAQKVCQQIRKFLGIPSLDDIMREKKKT